MESDSLVLARVNLDHGVISLHSLLEMSVWRDQRIRHHTGWFMGADCGVDMGSRGV